MSAQPIATPTQETRVLESKVLEHLKCSHAALDVANAELTKVANEKQAAAPLIPQAVEALVKHRRIGADQAKMAAEALEGVPARALSILIKTADPNYTIDPPAIGKPEPTSKKGDGANDERQSDRAFIDKMLS